MSEYSTINISNKIILDANNSNNHVIIDKNLNWYTKYILFKQKPIHHNDDTLHGKLSRFVHSEKLHHALNILLILDIILLVITMQLELYYMESKIHDFENSCKLSLSCLNFNEYGNEKIQHTEHILAKISISILIIFLVELFIVMIADGIITFFKHPLHVLDLFVVSVTMFFELQNTDNLALSLAIIARSWRFMRFVHGVLDIEGKTTGNGIIAEASDNHHNIDDNNHHIETKEHTENKE